MMRWLIEEGLARQDEQRLRLTRKGSMLCDEISIRLARDVSL
jgi:coproporphyrinogen III oxidase-like Fe-S oxidoreductase